MDDSSIQVTPFVKQLAAVDRPTRDQALQSLQTYLSGRREFTSLDLLKLHKGLFYSLWLCDRPLPQQNLAASFANILTILPTSTVIPFLRAFWQTMSREWQLIDVLRMEKFLLVTRRYIFSTFQVLKSRGWEEGIVKGAIEVLEEVPMNVEDQRIPMGLRFHVIDVYVDELERIGALGEEEGMKEIRDLLLEPMRKIARASPTKPVRMKARDALWDERIPGNEKVVEEDEVEKTKEDEVEKTKEDEVEKTKEDDEWGGIEE